MTNPRWVALWRVAVILLLLANLWRMREVEGLVFAVGEIAIEASTTGSVVEHKVSDLRERLKEAAGR